MSQLWGRSRGAAVTHRGRKGLSRLGGWTRGNNIFIAALRQVGWGTSWSGDQCMAQCGHCRGSQRASGVRQPGGL
jgi:hypothetical protein